MYANAKVGNHDKAKLLSLVKGDQDKILKSCSCSIKRLYDKRTSEDEGLSQEVISQIILPVNAYSIRWGGKKPALYFAFSVLMQGFLCHLMIPRFPHGKRNGPGFLNQTKDRLHTPRQYFLDYKPLMDSMVGGMGKHLDGRSTLPE